MKKHQHLVSALKQKIKKKSNSVACSIDLQVFYIFLFSCLVMAAIKEKPNSQYFVFFFILYIHIFFIYLFACFFLFF